MNQVMLKVVPALAAGNTVVLKPDRPLVRHHALLAGTCNGSFKFDRQISMQFV
jgi:acyl-CoA reductase-like NAD-dependent aldehyde dehydrogenase